MAERHVPDLEITNPVDAAVGADSGAAVPPPHPEERTLEARLRDHATIGRLADDVLPALIAQLSASALGEIEVREGDWKVRLRRPAEALGQMYGRRATDRPSRAQPGHAGHGHAPAAVEPRRGGGGSRAVDVVGTGSARDDSGGSTAEAGRRAGEESPGMPGGASPSDGVPGGGGSNGSHRQLTAVGPGPDPGARVGRMGHLPVGEEVPPAGDGPGEAFSFRAIATSPAVGIYQSRGEVRAGSRVRAGDRLATVDVLGVPQPVLAPADGLVGATLVEHGEPVEYGQELIRIELPEPGGELLETAPAHPATGSTTAASAAAADGPSTTRPAGEG